MSSLPTGPNSSPQTLDTAAPLFCFIFVYTDKPEDGGIIVDVSGISQNYSVRGQKTTRKQEQSDGTVSISGPPSRPSQVQKFFNDVVSPTDLKKTITIVVDTNGCGMNTVDILPILLSTVCQEEIQFQFRCPPHQARLEETLNKAIQQRSKWQTLIFRAKHIYISLNGLRIDFYNRGLVVWEEGMGWEEGIDTAPNKFWGDLGFEVQETHCYDRLELQLPEELTLPDSVLLSVVPHLAT
ncbi:hypothetical protein BU25DRAFT_417557 [Macroventuria anomochaeta]|uniref:Uncharacterized protein n=1 Tax=Macroventuria anomochaeta TaxID=301207 RepID=A0ACB6SFG5_9PLEO|nr:uncharacterized protein BU25DRAFT_417557 [Macroventuria anomochaeta]KAF2633020.1 hypothetical protein BU25DRAFT_417557 [Macroventuria anomochaeta]